MLETFLCIVFLIAIVWAAAATVCANKNAEQAVLCRNDATFWREKCARREDWERRAVAAEAKLESFYSLCDSGEDDD